MSGALSHVETDRLDHRGRLEGNPPVSGHRLGEDHHVGTQTVLLGEGFGADDCRGGATGRRTRHQAGHHTRPEDYIVHHVFGGDDFLEQRQRVIRGVTAGLGADSGKGAQLGAVLLHVLTTGATKLAQRHGYADRDGVGGQLVHHAQVFAHARRAIIEYRTQCAGLHLLEAQGQGAFDRPAFHCLASQVQGGRAGGAVVVDVNHRHATHADFVERRLAAGGVAVDVADIGLLDQVVVQACVFQGEAGRFSAHLDVGATGTGLQERDHADPGNIRFLRHHISPNELSLLWLLVSAARRPEQTELPSLRSSNRLYPLTAGGAGWGGHRPTRRQALAVREDRRR
ncbi:hypothetical protein D9M70_390930 [compost metagenome]